jgi:hypothetical protein
MRERRCIGRATGRKSRGLQPDFPEAFRDTVAPQGSFATTVAFSGVTGLTGLLMVQ